MVLSGSCVTFFDHGPQPRERLIPLFGNEVEVGLDFLNGRRLEHEQAFASGPEVTHDAGAFQHAQVLGDGLPGQARPIGKLGDRLRFTTAEARNQLQTCRIAKGRKH